ncbi:hypothetical protein NPIL_552801 [Nephila pilipes]|uniref:Uncharacterized protein n=1 Tax=Nephila pilipes TaxID=299642 RepID=A0A8X6NUG0_NEPPI|nr:hypothetical protein NPIL_552801 [Nephila pilipes]
MLGIQVSELFRTTLLRMVCGTTPSFPQTSSSKPRYQMDRIITSDPAGSANMHQGAPQCILWRNGVWKNHCASRRTDSFPRSIIVLPEFQLCLSDEFMSEILSD